MKYAALILAVLFVPCAAFATACNSDCTFIRGDVDCSGSITGSDLYALLNGYIVNQDAADVNDDGSITSSDYYRLSYWYYNHSNPPPECPFPGLGLDCTPDALENCCSPPTNANSAITQTCGTGTANKDSWDNKTDSQSTSGGKCIGFGSFFNDNAALYCSGHGSQGTFDLTDIQVTDPVKFTKKRMANDVQFAYLAVEVDSSFSVGADCQEYQCDGQNWLTADIHPTEFYVDVTVRPVTGGGADQTITVAGFDCLQEFNYERYNIAGDCAIRELDDNDPDACLSVVNITSQLAGISGSDCAEFKVVELSAYGYVAEWNLGGMDDIATIEHVTLESLKVVVSYAWCTCQ